MTGSVLFCPGVTLKGVLSRWPLPDPGPLVAPLVETALDTLDLSGEEFMGERAVHSFGKSMGSPSPLSWQTPSKENRSMYFAGIGNTHSEVESVDFIHGQQRFPYTSPQRFSSIRPGFDPHESPQPQNGLGRYGSAGNQHLGLAAQDRHTFDHAVSVNQNHQCRGPVPQQPGPLQVSFGDYERAGSFWARLVREGDLAPGNQAQHRARPALDLNGQGVTTLMVRNIPVGYTREKLLREWPCDSTYDFFYLPCNFDSARHMTFAFINFTNPAFAEAFLVRWHRQKLPGSTAKKALDITAADVQGWAANIVRFQRAKSSRVRNPAFYPLIFQDGQRIEFMEAFPQVVASRPVDERIVEGVATMADLH